MTTPTVSAIPGCTAHPAAETLPAFRASARQTPSPMLRAIVHAVDTVKSAGGTVTADWAAAADAARVTLARRAMADRYPVR